MQNERAKQCPTFQMAVVEMCQHCRPTWCKYNICLEYLCKRNLNNNVYNTNKILQTNIKSLILLKNNIWSQNTIRSQNNKMFLTLSTIHARFHQTSLPHSILLPHLHQDLNFLLWSETSIWRDRLASFKIMTLIIITDYQFTCTIYFQCVHVCQRWSKYWG